MTFSVVIPTKNRPRELLNAFKAILNQTRLPDQIIIVDQSIPRNVLEKKLKAEAKKVNLFINYIHDQAIDGLVEAKAFAISLNKCDYISFFDDDIILEKEYFKMIEKTLKSFPEIIGANGVISNYPDANFFKKLIFQITHFGIYKDERYKIQTPLLTKRKNPLKINVLSGGLSTWKKEVFENLSFDTKNKFHSYEDVEFSIRVDKTFPGRMFVIPQAKLSHHHASLNRQSTLLRTQNDVIEIWMLFKKNRNFNLLGLDFFVLTLGLFLKSIILSFRYRSMHFVRNFFRGFIEGFKRQVSFQ
tara:strand:- start:97 stop:999 length:903 start_codon:yes stop_codon:yes gene_type:complete